MSFSNTPTPPYYAVIFTSIKNEDTEYEKMAKQILNLVQNQPGFLGIESAREEIGISVSYWENLEAIANWKGNFEHQIAQKLGKEKFYKSYKVRICKVERDYDFIGSL
ncbi:MAG: antibiotic biosynthesis monooxygenase [Vicingus serpentipes]|nr:antibiotic biosynthesis monooxygenase [Vicingus serpentipes]